MISKCDCGKKLEIVEIGIRHETPYFYRGGPRILSCHRPRFFPLSSSLAKGTEKKNKVSAHAAAAKYNLWRPTDTKIHHDLELSYSPHTGVFREHECRTVVGPISTKEPQRQKPRTKNTIELQTDYKKNTKKKHKKTQ